MSWTCMIGSPMSVLRFTVDYALLCDFFVLLKTFLNLTGKIYTYFLKDFTCKNSIILLFFW